MTPINHISKSSNSVHYLFYLTVIFLLISFSSCKKEQTGKPFFPGSVVVGDTTQYFLSVHDDLGADSAILSSSSSVFTSYNIDNLGPNDIGISAQHIFQLGIFDYSNVYLQTESNHVKILTDVNGEPRVLNESDTIYLNSGNWQSGNFVLSSVYNSSGSGPWYDQHEKYLGIKIGDYQLGWMKLSVTPSVFTSSQSVSIHEIGSVN